MPKPERVEGKSFSTTTNDEGTLIPKEAKTAIEKVEPAGGAMGVMLADAINNAREVFGFEEKFIQLGTEGAYQVHGKVQPYGQGALQIGRLGGVYIHTPVDLVHEDGLVHKNPYIVRNVDGVIVEANYRKVVIHMNPSGHVKFKDFIFSRSITVDLARRAMKLMRSDKVPANAKRFASRTMVERWNEESEEAAEPGCPMWLYYELPNNPMGIAINTNDPHEEVLKFIDGNIEVENFFKSSTETKGERRAIWYVVPESFKPLEGEHAPVIAANGDVTSAWFSVMAPTKAGVLLVLLQKFLMAMLSEDQEAVLQAKEAFAAAMGTTPDTIQFVEVRDDELDRTTDPDKLDDWQNEKDQVTVSQETGEVILDPVPKTIKKIGDFQEYVKAQLPKLTLDEISFLGTRGKKYLDATMYDDDGNLIPDNLPGGINADNASKFATAFRKIIKDREEASTKKDDDQDMTPTQAREFISVQLTEGSINKVNAVLEKHGATEGVSIEDLDQEIVMKVYHELTQSPEADSKPAPETDSKGQGKLL